MGNDTSLENWAARERVLLIERAAWWRGWIGRGDLVAMFGISPAQASSDLQKYQELNPGALVYQLSRKRYEGAAGMVCVLHEPRLEDGIGMFLGARAAGVGAVVAEAECVAVAVPPQRVVKAEVARALVRAVCGGMAVRVRYHSVRSGKAAWRELVPRAFGHDGLRWHARAWCVASGEWRDFVFGRISAAEEPVAVSGEPPRDEDWETMETLRFRVNPELSPDRQAALAMDYGLGRNGVLKLTCRRAMRQYVEAMLRVPVEGRGLPGHFVQD